MDFSICKTCSYLLLFVPFLSFQTCTVSTVKTHLEDILCLFNIALHTLYFVEYKLTMGPFHCRDIINIILCIRVATAKIGLSRIWISLYLLRFRVAESQSHPNRRWWRAKMKRIVRHAYFVMQIRIKYQLWWLTA